jgi:hypothetical protein
MSRSVVVILSIFFTLIFSGCGSANKQVSMPDSQLTQDKNRAYVVFTRPSLKNDSITPEIMEFNEKTYAVKFVGNMSAGSKFIYPISAGEHYFFMNSKDDDIIKIEAEAGKRYVVKVVVDKDSSFEKVAFVPVTKNSYDQMKLLKKSQCSSSTLKKYDLKQVNGTTRYKNSNLEAECVGRDFSKINSGDVSYSDLDLSGVKTVEPTEESKSDFIKSHNDYMNDLKLEYTKWKRSSGTRMTVDQGLPAIRF